MKLTPIVAVVLITAAFCVHAAAATWVDENFDNYNVGSLYGQGYWTGDDGPVRVETGFVKSGKSVEVNYKLWGLNDSTQEEEVRIDVSSGSREQHIDVDVAMDTATSSSAGTNLGYIKFLSWSGQDITRIYLAHQQIKVMFSPGAVAVLTDVQPRVWHHVHLVVNLTSGTLEAWVDGVLKASGSVYRLAPNITKIVVGQWNLGSTFTKTETYVDNLVGADAPIAQTPASWTSPDRYRVLLMVDPLGVVRRNSPAHVDLDFPELLAQAGAAGTFDENTIEVVAYDSQGAPVVYDTSRSGYERYLLPWRIQNYYGINESDLSFVMPDDSYMRYAVYFDTLESGLGRPQRYRGLVGDGDLFSQGYGRREIGPSKFGDMFDLDGDGDLDLFEGGVEPFVYVHENVGGNQLVDRGRLTSGGSLLIFPRNSGSNRAWMTITGYDWDKDGDVDLFPSFTDGPDNGQIVFYRNTTIAGGQLTFTRVGQMLTQAGTSMGGGGWFPTPTFVVDWDGTGDGLTDVLVSRSEWDGGFTYLYRNLGPGGTLGWRFAEGVRLQAGGQDINLTTPRFECADIDSDGDLDLLAASHDWGATHVYWYRNTGTRQSPVFAAAVELASMPTAYPGLKVADLDNDGLRDISVGTFWKQVETADPQCFGALLKNMGPASNPTFQLRYASSGSLYTEQFQQCDSGQQNGVRSLDWDNDGDHDLVASSSGGMLTYFRNTTNDLFPVYGPRETLMVGGANPYPVETYGVESGYARHDMADWNNDGRIDLVVGDESARAFVFLNDGLGHDPPTFLPGYQLYENGKPLDCLMRGSAMVCDWNNDGRKDLIFGMAPKQDDLETPYDWPDTGDGNKTNDEGILYYRNDGSNGDPRPGSSTDSRMLAYPSWLWAGGQRITYTRPNLGNFVDWDGDGVKDLIASEFESNVMLYENTGSGAPNTTPQLAAPITLVQPYVTTQMVSGADVLNFNGDSHPSRPDLDVITGQGHGGSGLRYYERDYVEDFVHGTYPVVSVGSPEHGVGILDAKVSGDGSTLTVTGAVVTASFDGVFYIQSEDRPSGIRVERLNHGRTVGQRVDVVGPISTNADGERYVAATGVTLNGSGSIAPLAFTGKSVGGGDFFYNPGTGAGQMGVIDGIGLNSIGLLITTSARFTYVDPQTFTIDDGSGVAVRCVVPAGVTLDPEWEYVAVTGISSCYRVGGDVHRLLRVRVQTDIVPLQ